MTEIEKRKPICDNEALAILGACKNNRALLLNKKYYNISYNISLRYIKNLSQHTNTLFRYGLALSAFDFDILHEPRKLNLAAHCISRLDYSEIHKASSVENSEFFSPHRI